MSVHSPGQSSTTNGVNTTGTITPIGTTGNQTINKGAGTINIAATATSVTLTNNLIGANTIVLATLQTNDATAVLKSAVVTAGQCVFNISTAAAATLVVGWSLIQVS